MNLDDKTIGEIARQLGMNQSAANTQATKDVIKKEMNKSDEELVREIMELKNKLIGKNVPKEKQISAIKSLMPMMNNEQKTRLVKLIELLESS